MVYGKAWRTSHLVYMVWPDGHGMLYDMVWLAYHGIWYGLAGME